MAVGSRYLWTCFDGGFQEAHDGVLRVRECSRGTDELPVALMSFLYTGTAADEVRVGADGGELLRLGALWEVKGLREWAMRSLDERDVCAAVQYGIETEDEELTKEGVKCALVVPLGEMSVQCLKGVSVEAMLKVLHQHPEGKGVEVLYLALRWWGANGSGSGWAREEDCRELARMIDIHGVSGAELRRLMGMPWLYEDGYLKGVLEDRERSWGRYTRFSEESSFQLHGPGSDFTLGFNLFEDGRICMVSNDVHSTSEDVYVNTYTADGTHVFSFEPRQTAGTKNYGARLCVRPGADTIYVAARHPDRRIDVHQRDGTFIRSFGKYASAAGEPLVESSIDVADLAVSREGEAFVCSGGRVLVYGEDGEFLRVLWQKTRHADGPAGGVAVSPRDGSVMVITARKIDGQDLEQGLVMVLNQEGVVERTFGERVLQHPMFVAVGAQGDVVIAEKTGKVYVFSPEGELLQEFGETNGGFKDVSNVAVRADRRILVLDRNGMMHVMSAMQI
mmetsp:Transcript_61337/g.150941  ORF Transcript_61337/g.150941 Transcript_61337/m.150941 type:complete len:506 (+) Transcript_61337:195-1712(+)